jgi:cytochrome c553
MPTLIPRTVLAAVLAAASTAAFGQSVSHGRTLYQNVCNSCHGTPPVGGAATAPNDPARIRNAINGGRPEMSFLRGMYSDADLADIAAYIASVQGGAAPPPPAGPIVPLFDYTDLWWNPGESGWGFNIIQHASHVIFGVIYTYDAPNRPMWFVLPGGAWVSPITFTGKLYRVTGSPGNMAFRAGEVVEVGNATLLFNGANDATLTYSVNGVQVSKAITRQPF